MAVTSKPTVLDAHQALIVAEQRVTEAEAAVTAARDELDVALAGAGWTRVHGALITAVYQRRNGNVADFGQVISYELEQEAAA